MYSGGFLFTVSSYKTFTDLKNYFSYPDSYDACSPSSYFTLVTSAFIFIYKDHVFSGNFLSWNNFQYYCIMKKLIWLRFALYFVLNGIINITEK